MTGQTKSSIRAEDSHQQRPASRAMPSSVTCALMSSSSRFLTEGRAAPVPGRHGQEPSPDLTLGYARLVTWTAHISIVSDSRTAGQSPGERRAPATECAKIHRRESRAGPSQGRRGRRSLPAQNCAAQIPPNRRTVRTTCSASTDIWSDTAPDPHRTAAVCAFSLTSPVAQRDAG